MIDRKLEQIGFYTLCDERAKNLSTTSPLYRCELILTDRCNFKCPYCKGLRQELKGDMELEVAKKSILIFIKNRLKNIRFSGGEPAIYPHLLDLVKMCKDGGVERIAISTNGSAKSELYLKLIDAGVNDFSISLDGCCSSMIDKMSGTSGKWKILIDNIKLICKNTYATAGMVFTEENINQCRESIIFAHDLGFSDIRVIPSAQYNNALTILEDLPKEILDVHPILNYRINNTKNSITTRGLTESDCNTCWLVCDDAAIVRNEHFPCIIYLREKGLPIGTMSENFREERLYWMKNNNIKNDPICSRNCLDVCRDYNNKANFFKNNN